MNNNDNSCTTTKSRWQVISYILRYYPLGTASLGRTPGFARLSLGPKTQSLRLVLRAAQAHFVLRTHNFLKFKEN